MPSLRWAPHRAASDPCPKKHEEARRGLWAPLCARGLEVLLSAKSSRAPSFLGILLFLRRNNTFPVFATYLIPAASPPPLRGGAKSASNPFARARKPHTWFFSLSGSVALPGFTLMPARSGFAWQPQMLSWHLLRRLVLCHRSPTWFRMLTAHRFLFYFSLVCLPVALQVSILAAQLDVAEGGAPHSQSARVPLSSSSASSC